MNKQRRLTIGLIVNSFAGIGGEAALKGSDGEAIRQKALEYKDLLRAPGRLQQCLAILDQQASEVHWLTGAGMMGADYLSGLPTQSVEVIYQPEDPEHTSAEDTQHLAKLLVDAGVDLILFCGGDGTARDVLDVVGLKLPCLGLPSGVKMQSGVFAISPSATAKIIQHIMRNELPQVAEQDVRDIDEAALRDGKVRSRYYGSMLVPDEPRYLQNLKVGGVEHEPLVLDDIADYLTELMDESGSVFLVGPGSTTAHWMASMGLDDTLVGFDAVQAGELVASDLTARDIEELFQAHPDIQVVITPTGNQGMLLGRGNQQLSSSVISRLKKSQWLIIATKNKLKCLQGRPFLVDTNNPELDEKLCGLYPVITGYNDRVLYPVNTSYE